MKKVLTLMGALSVAGSALAHDYLWNMSDLSGKNWSAGFTEGALDYKGDSNSSYDEVKNGVVSAVKGSETNNRFKFAVEAGDIVTVHAITVSNNTGKVYLKQNGLETNADIDNSGSTVLTVSTNESAGGDVFVYADANVVITKIVVVSAKYNEVVDKIAAARTAVDDAKSDRLASLVTKYDDFYAAITRQISLKVSNQIIAIENQLAKDAAENKVSQLAAGTGTGDALIAQLDALVNTTTGVLKGIEDAAAAAKTAYETTFLKGADYKTAKATKDLAYKDNPTVDEAKGYTIKKVTKTNGSGAATAWADKADGLRTYMDNVAKRLYDEALEDAKKELANFPWTDDLGNDHTYPVDTYNTKMQTTVTYIKNIIDRFVYEEAHKSEYSTLKSNVENTEGHITKAGLTKPTTPVDFDALKTGVTDLYNLLNKTDNKETYNKAEIDNPGTEFKQVLEGYQTQYSGVQTTLTKEAKKKQDEECAATQKALNEYSGKITEQFTGQPEAQAKYEQEFAKLQVRLDKIKAYKGDKDGYDDRVKNYATRMSEIAQINKEVNELWQSAQTDQNNEVIAQNNTNKTKLDGEITDALTAYNDGVNKINGYKNINGIDETAKAKIDAQLVKVFDYARIIEDTKKAANQAILAANTASPATSFDYAKYSTDITTQVNNIKTAIADARSAANDAANEYLTQGKLNTWGTRDAVPGTLPYAKDQIDDAYASFGFGTPSDYNNQYYGTYGDLSGSDLKAEAKLKIDSLKDAKFDAESNFIEGTGIYSTTNDFVTLHNQTTYIENGVTKQRDIADYISVVANKLQPLDGKLKDVLARVKAYDECKAEITKLKIRWSVSKANVKTGFEGVNLNDTLIAINKEIVALETKLTTAGFGAQEKKPEILADIEGIDAELWKVDNYDIYLANEASLVEINAAIKVVKVDEINAAKAEVQKLVTEEVKTDYIAKLEAIDFSAIEASRDQLYAEHKLNDTAAKDGIKASLATISAQIAQLVADAKAADKAAQEVPGDVNGDKSVDAADYEAIEYFAVAGDDAELTDEEKALRAKADLNGDGTVNLSDLSEFVKLYQSKDAE